MNKNKLHKQKKQAQLDQWQVEVDQLKGKMSRVSVELHVGLNKQIERMEGKIDQAKAKLDEFAGTS